MVLFTINVVFKNHKTLDLNSDLFLSSNLRNCSHATLRSPARGDDETNKRQRTDFGLAMHFASRVPQAIHYGRNFHIFSKYYEAYVLYEFKNYVQMLKIN